MIRQGPFDIDSRPGREIRHSEKLAAEETEWVWGWGSPAGKVRAARRAGLIAAQAGLCTQSYALEIGCGTGVFTAMFARSGARIVAVDISPDLLEKARKRDLPPWQIAFVEKSFEDCAVDGPFDAVIGSSILHHLDLLPSCSKIYCLLKPGGVMSFAEPNYLNPQIFLERKFRRFFPYISQDETAFVRWRLLEVLRNTGFTDTQIVPFDWLHPATPKALIPPTEWLGSVAERIPLLLEFSGSLLISARKPS